MNAFGRSGPKLKPILTAFLFVLVVSPRPVAGDILDFFRSDALTNGSRFAFAPSQSKAAIVVVDTLDHKLVAELEIPHVPHSVVVSEDLDLLIATNPDNESVTVINLYTREVIRELDIGMRPDAALLNPFDRFVAFGSRDGSVSVWDMHSFEPMLRVDSLSSALSMTYGFDGRNLYVIEQAKKTVSVIEMHARRKVAEISLGGEKDAEAEVSAMSRSADGYTGYVSLTSENRVVVLDLIDWVVKDSIPVGRGPIRTYSTADNRYVLVPNRDDETLTVLSALSHEVVATIPTGVKARELNTGWLDTVAFIMPEEGNEIAVVNLRTLKQESSISLPGRTDDGLVTSDSKTLMASLIDSGQLVAIDARSREIEAIIDTGAKTLEGIEIAVSNNVCH
jgi:DNA-binding beta-propeller fold protein YncE